MGDVSFSKLHDLIKEIALKAVESAKPSGIFYGTVVSTSPLKIQLEQKIILDAEFLILTSLVRDFSISMTVDHSTESEIEHIHQVMGTKTFRLHLGLRQNEKVILLRVQGGQQYLVLDRVRWSG